MKLHLSQRALRLGALLWVANGLLVGATPALSSHAHDVIESDGGGQRGASIDVSVVDERGAPLFARVGVQGGGGQSLEVLALGPRGAQLVLEAGSYQVRASRGPEWSIVTQQLDVRSGEPSKLTLVLRRELDPGGYVGCDFHVHSDHSPDSEVTLDARVASIAAEGLDFAVPTEHNEIIGYGDMTAREAVSFGSLPGVELTTWAPSIGHFNVFPASYVPKTLGRSPDELFAELRADPRVVIQVNHPRLEDHIAYFHLGRIGPEGQLGAPSFNFDFDVLEVWNGYDLARAERRDRVFREWLQVLAAGHRIVASGNSDSHDLARQKPGYPRTYVWLGEADPRSNPELVSASLKAGRAFVTSGPLLDVEVDGERPGASIQPSGDHARVEVRVQAASWMRVDTIEVWGGTRRLVAAPISAVAAANGEPLDTSVVLDVPIAGVPFLVVTVSGREPMEAIGARRGAQAYGFANPIWITESASRATRQ